MPVWLQRRQRRGRRPRRAALQSASTPFAAGVAALVLSANPRLTSTQVRLVLQDTADKIGPKSSYKASGHSNEFGYGRVNAVRAVAQAQWLAAGKSAPEECE
jgi:subtilisin family serine protease